MNDWVYSRTALAEHFLDSLDIGLVNRLALFGPRRRGKSLFLIHDLIPLAEKRGYFPVYASLWDNVDHPHIPILDSLRAAKQLIQKRGKLTTLLTTPITKLTLGNAVIKADIEFAPDPKAPASGELSEISALITDIAHIKPNKTLLLLIDEVQHIATQKISLSKFNLSTRSRFQIRSVFFSLNCQDETSHRCPVEKEHHIFVAQYGETHLFSGGLDKGLKNVTEHC